MGDKSGRGAGERNIEGKIKSGVWKMNIGEDSGRGMLERLLGSNGRLKDVTLLCQSMLR